MECEDHRGELQGEPDGPQPTESKDDAEARRDFWSIQGDFIHRHHMEPRVQLHMPNEETFPILLKYIDVTRGLLTQIWMCCKKNVVMIMGMWTRIEVYQILGKDS